MRGTRSPTQRQNNNRQTMDHKTLVNRFTKACYRFEAIQEDLDILLFDTDDEIKANEYEDLADQAAEIVLKLSANGHNVGGHFYHYYLRRLEYIIAYFRELLDDEETPLAEDKQDELDDEPAAETHFEGFPAGCAFPKEPDFVIKKWEFKLTPTAKDEENAATDEAGAVEEDDSEDEQSDKVDNENDTQAAESDEAADDPAAGAPLPLEEKPCTSVKLFGLDSLSSEDRTRVRETFSMWYEMNGVTERNREDGDTLTAAAILKGNEFIFNELKFDMELGDEDVILIDEERLRKTINEAIDAIPDFRDSEEFKKLIELYPTYKEIEQ